MDDSHQHLFIHAAIVKTAMKVLQDINSDKFLKFLRFEW